MRKKKRSKIKRLVKIAVITLCFISIVMLCGCIKQTPIVSDVTFTTSNPIDTNLMYGWENITCNVTNGIRVTRDIEEISIFSVFSNITYPPVIHSVFLNVTYPNLHTVNVSMVNSSDGQYYYNTTYTDVGSYSYFIWANDTSNNSIISSIGTFAIPPNYDIRSLTDRIIDISDLNAVSLLLGNAVTAGSIREDVNNDGFIDISDLNQVSLHMGEEWG